MTNQKESRSPTPSDVIDVSVDGIDTRDYPDFSDAHISEAFWKDSGEPLTVDELMELSDNYPDFVYELVQDKLF
mgnify:CR=1 FL=1